MILILRFFVGWAPGDKDITPVYNKPIILTYPYQIRRANANTVYKETGKYKDK